MRHEPVRHMVNLRKGDQVKVVSGRDRGKTGRVLSIDAWKNVKGGIVEREGPMSVSNVMLLCPGCHKHTRIAHVMLPDGTKARACRRCGATLDA